VTSEAVLDHEDCPAAKSRSTDPNSKRPAVETVQSMVRNEQRPMRQIGWTECKN